MMSASSAGVTISVCTSPSASVHWETSHLASSLSSSSSVRGALRWHASYERMWRSSCDAVRSAARPTRNPSFSGLVTRQRARTFEYERRPSASASCVSGNSSSRRATVRWSRAARPDAPHRAINHATQDTNPSARHNSRRSNSASTDNHHARCDDCSAVPRTRLDESSPSESDGNDGNDDMCRIGHPLLA